MTIKKEHRIHVRSDEETVNAGHAEAAARGETLSLAINRFIREQYAHERLQRERFHDTRYDDWARDQYERANEE